MNRIFIFLFIFLFSCGRTNTPQKAENALDAGREFIQACLNGDFKHANAYMLQDSGNDQYLEQVEADWSNRTSEYHNQYKNASINIESIDAVSDSITIINYKNSFDKVGRKIKIVSSGNTWLVDFKYTFSGNL